MMVAGIAMANPEMSLRAIGAQLEAMRERTPRGGRQWAASSVKNLLDQAEKLGLAPLIVTGRSETTPTCHDTGGCAVLLRSRDAMVRRARASFAARYRDETAFDLGKEFWGKRAVVPGFAIDGPQVRPGQAKRLFSVRTIQERASSRPRRALVMAGISIASAGSASGACVIGRTRTSGAPSSSSSRSPARGRGDLVALVPALAMLPVPQ